jgi:hypothetical protein
MADRRKTTWTIDDVTEGRSRIVLSGKSTVREVSPGGRLLREFGLRESSIRGGQSWILACKSISACKFNMAAKMESKNGSASDEPDAAGTPAGSGT